MASVRPVFFVDLLSGLFPKKPMSSTRFSYIVSLLFALVIEALESERGLLPRQGSAFREGHKKSSLLFAKEFLGGNGKAEDTKLPGAGIPPKPCPMERVKMETMYELKANSFLGEREAQSTRDTPPSSHIA